MTSTPGFGTFLRARRERLDPAQVGLPVTDRRRTPGLRRSEVAGLAAISVEYYTRLEQGRSGPPSAAVLDSLAGALRLDADERTYLLSLAFPHPDHLATHVERRDTPPVPGAGVRALLDALDDTAAALVVGPDLAVLAWNRLATLVLTDFAACPPARRNLARHWFGDPAAPALYADRESTGAADLRLLHCMLRRRPGDVRLLSLVDELSADPEFVRYWSQSDGAAAGTGPRTLQHPLAGRLELYLDAFTIPGPAGLTMLTYLAAPGSDSQRRLTELAHAA